MPRSIRWRLLLWFGFLLGALLAGFGATSHQLQRLRMLGKVDQELGNRLAALSGEMRLGGGPPRPRPRPAPDTGGNSLGRPPRFDPSQGPPPPGEVQAPGHQVVPGPRPEGPGGRGGPAMGGPEGFRPEGPPPELPPGPLALTTELRRMVAEDGNYFAVWGQNGELRENSLGGTKLAMPARPSRDVSLQVRSRGDLREVYHFNERGGCVLVGRSIAPLLGELRADQARLWAAGLAVLVAGLGGCWWITVRSLRPIGEISLAARRIADGEFSERIPVAEPENELGGLAAVLNETFGRLDEAFSRQVRFTADASHELRTPLAMMISEAQTTLARQRDAGEYREALEHCHQAAQRMRALVAALLDLARLDARDVTAQGTEIELAEWLGKSLERLAPLALEAGCTVERALAPVRVTADPTRLELALTNLFTNAVHYNVPGGLIRVSCRAEGDFALLSIQDSGQGIAESDLPRIFERFFRVDPSRSRAEGRVGLGLAICQAAVLAEGGTLSVTSRINEGSTFDLRLPVSPAPDPQCPAG
jgi:signal transduction histidine kinase